MKTDPAATSTELQRGSPSPAVSGSEKRVCEAKGMSALMGTDCFSTHDVQPVRVLMESYVGNESPYINMCRSCRKYFENHFGSASPNVGSEPPFPAKKN